MFSVRQPFPMLMAARRNHQDADFESLLSATVVLAFRYNVIGVQHTGEQERVYHAVALRIARAEITRASEVLEGLRPIYLTDDGFRAAFADKSIKTTATRNNKVVRYILCKLERQWSGLEVDFDSSSYTIEHVLPQNPVEGWEAFRDSDLESFIYRLGNMTMLEAGKNRDIGNVSFVDKKTRSAGEHVCLDKKIAEDNADWTPERIESRQRALANIAASVWRIAQLS